MRRTFALILALVVCLSLFAGCKKKAAETSVPGQTQEVGNLKVFVPDGWSLVSDDQGVYVCKGSGNLSADPYIKVQYYGAGSSLPIPDENWCTDAASLEPRALGSYSWNGLSGTKVANNTTFKITYLWTQSGDHKFLLTLWGEHSLDDKAVQAIVAGAAPSGSGAAQADPAPTPAPVADPSTIIGDWCGVLELRDCTGDYETSNGISGICIARFAKDSEGNILVFIGTAEQCGTVSIVAAHTEDEETMLMLSGSWNGKHFDSVTATLDAGTLQLNIPIMTDTGDVQLAISLRTVGDTGWTDQDPKPSADMLSQCSGKSFDALAELLGYSADSYPAAN